MDAIGDELDSHEWVRMLDINGLELEVESSEAELDSLRSMFTES
ncbi:hypothetical protein [Vibrio sonorensis]|nr:hypothetical protein [Vibrio sonorensis]